MKNKIISIILTLSMLVVCVTVTGIVQAKTISDDSSVSASANSPVSSGSQAPQSTIQGSNVLHCFNWSYNSIKANLQAIKDAGYTAVQTSPVQTPKDYNSGWTDISGQWWKLYQPIDFEVSDGNTWLGTKAQLKSLCDTANSMGIKVIVDIVANHMANINTSQGTQLSNIHSGVSETLRNDASYWHINDYWADDYDRYRMTVGSIGQPDLNTGNTYIQNSFKNLLIECINLGVDGFRFDAAKHIELPNETSGNSSQFWPTVINGASGSTTEDIYYYGEILGSPQVSIKGYTQYMSVTDNYTSDCILAAAVQKSGSGVANSYYSKEAGADKSVLWVESHDTYMGNSGSAGIQNTSGISDSVIEKAWAIVGSRANATSLFFARPGTGQTMGEASTNTTWKSDVVAQVNKFKNYFEGTEEYLAYDGSIAYNERGTSGVVISNLSGGSSYVSLKANKILSGTYKDRLTGNIFTVDNGKINGTIGDTGVAVVYNLSTDTTTSATTTATTTVQDTTSSTSVSLTTTAEPTTVTTKKYIIGDVNLDETVTIEDATLIQKYLAEITILSDTALKLGDTNGDNRVDIKDVTCIQCFIAEIIGLKNTGDYIELETTTQEPTTEEPTTEEPTTEEATTEASYYTVICTDSLSWGSNISCYYWSDYNTTMTSWPGVKMTYAGTNSYGQKYYKVSVPSTAKYIIFNDGKSSNGSQTVNIDFDGKNLKYYVEKTTTSGKYNVGVWT